MAKSVSSGTKTMEDLLLKCDVHKDKKLKMFCQDHSLLCCTDCVLLNHRQCKHVALISESLKNLTSDMPQLSNNLQTMVDKLNKFKTKIEASVENMRVLSFEKLQEMEDLRKKLHAALDALTMATFKQLDEILEKLLNPLKKDLDNCIRLKNDLKTLSKAINGLHDKSKKELEFIASRKCLDKIQESESYLKENLEKVQSPIIFQANNDIEQFLSQQSSLGSIVHVESMECLTVKRTSEYIVSVPSDKRQLFQIIGICSLPSGQVIVADNSNKKVKLLDQHYNMSSYCDVSDAPWDICHITSNEVAITFNNDVQFISVNDGQLVNGRKLSLQHAAQGIAHHQGALYVTSGTALYHYTLTGSLVKKLFEDARNQYTVNKCGVSPAGDRIYVTNCSQNKLITLATDGTLISTFEHPALQFPKGAHVTPAGQVLVCGYASNTVIQVDHEGRQKLATLASQTDGLNGPVSVCCNTNTHQIIVGQNNNSKIIVMDLQ